MAEMEELTKARAEEEKVTFIINDLNVHILVRLCRLGRKKKSIEVCSRTTH